MLQLYSVKFKETIRLAKHIFTLNKILVGVGILYLLLLYKDPFSQRTLVPNLEPYPDTINYIVPVRNLLQGGPFKIAREGRSITPNVPPLYSISLIPFYLISIDARMFFYANIVFSLASFYLFYLIIRKVTENRVIVFASLFLYATNFYLYWYPQWAMSENLILPLFLAGIYLLTFTVHIKDIFLAILIASCFYITKYAYLPISVLYLFLYFIKILLNKKKHIQYVFLFLVLLLFFVSLILVYQYFVQGINIVGRLISIFVGVLNKPDLIPGYDSSVVAGAQGWFSQNFFTKNLPQYIRGLLGNKTRLLWDSTPILQKYLVAFSWIGLLWGVCNKKTRYLSFSLVILILLPVIVIATFSTFDMRYIYHVIPTLLIGLVLFFLLVEKTSKKVKLRILFYGFVSILTLFYLWGNMARIKSQIVINLKYAETPWYYISVLKLNDYFSKEKITDGSKPVVISPMVPYYIDFYSNGNYQLLPLSVDQEFRLNKEEAWGYYDYSNLHNLYENFIKEGKQVYVARYGLGNESYLNNAFKDLENDFRLTEVYSGCYSQCNIYKLDLGK